MIVNKGPAGQEGQYLIANPNQMGLSAGRRLAGTQQASSRAETTKTHNRFLQAMKRFFCGEKNEFTQISQKQGGSSTEGPSAEDRVRENLLGQLRNNNNAWSFFQAMRPEDQESFLKLSEKYSSPSGKGSIGGLAGRQKSLINPDLMKILEQGKVNAKDKYGRNLVQNLAQMDSQPFDQGIDKKKVMEETFATVANPNIIQQGLKGTCTVTTLEYLHAKRYPAEFVRTLSGLVSTGRTAELYNGEPLRRAYNVRVDDGSCRTNVDRIYQASMMDYHSRDGYYDNMSDSRVKRTVDQYGREKVEKSGGAIKTEDYNDLLSAVLPYKSTLRRVTPQDRPTSERELTEILSRRREVPLSLNWNKFHHKMLLEGMDRDYVYLRNPWGDGDRGSASDSHKDAPVREALSADGSHSGGHVRMTRDEFFNRLCNYNVPE